MADIKFSALAPDVLIEVQGVPSFTIVHALRRAAIEFCDRTLLWEYDEDFVYTSTGEIEQDLPIPRGSELIQIMDITREGEPITPVPVSKMHRMQGDVTDESKWGIPTAYTAASNTTVRMAPIPSIDEELACRLALRPSATADDVPYELGTRWKWALVSGAKHFLCLMPNTEWHDPNRAMYYRGQFDKEIGRAKITQIQGYNNGQMRVKSVRFGG